MEIPAREESFLKATSGSGDYLAVTANALGRLALGTVSGANADSGPLYLHESGFFHWLRVKYGPGDRKASALYLAWYRDSGARTVKNRIGGLPWYQDPLGLDRAERNGLVFEESSFQFADPARIKDQDVVLVSYKRYRELVQRYLADVYGD